MAKCLAVVILLLVALATCHGRELLGEKDRTLATARGAGAGIGEAKVLGLPEVPVVGPVTGTSTTNGPVVAVPEIPAVPAIPAAGP
ncbi:unnamed protein product [Alopecurus aequalis]